jgi:phosphoribosylformylglycinamidine synthase
VQAARADGLLLAYHDRPTAAPSPPACEMAFASHLGLELNLDAWAARPPPPCSTRTRAIVQVASEDRAAFADLVNRHDLTRCAQRIGRPVAAPVVRVLDGREAVAEWTWVELFDAWWSVTHAMQKLRDDPDCADEERAARREFNDPGLSPEAELRAGDAPMVNTGAKPRVAILREQGVNSQQEMAAAFTKAGFLASTCT